MVARIRYFVLGIVVALVLATIAHATTWVFWIGAPNVNSPSSGANATWGNYRGGVTYLYSTQNVVWVVNSIPYVGSPFVSSTTSASLNALGSSGYETWVALSSAYAINNYAYQGTVGAYSNVAIGSNYTFSSGYRYFVAVAIYAVTSEMCGQLYFHADVYNNSTATAMLYVTYIIANSTWSYVTFFSGTASSGSWFNPAVPGPNTCLSPGFISSGVMGTDYYMYIAIIAVNTTEYIVGTAQVSVGTTSEGTSYTPGTQYAWGNTPSSGDTIVVPWTSYANPHVNYFVQQVVNTAGSSSIGWFYPVFPVYFANHWVGSYGYAFDVSWFIYAYDNDTGYFPQGYITAIGCPSGVYMLPATISPSVTKLVSCNGISSLSSGIAIYPTDYAKYSPSPVTYSPPTGYVVIFSYTDSAGNTYSIPDYFATPTTVYLYMASGTYSITTRQVSFPLQTNMSLFSLQPTNTSISSIDTGYFMQFPSCRNGYALPNCVANAYGSESIVFWFYEPQNGQGILLSLQTIPYPQYPHFTNNPWLYIQSGTLYASDSSIGSVSTPISPGWHMAVIEEYNSGGTYYLVLYLDGKYIGQVSSSSLPQLFSKYTYDYVGTGLNGGMGWWFFNGTIAYIAIYDIALNQSQVQQLYNIGFPNTLFSNNLVVAYLLTNTTYYVYDGVSHFYIKPYFANQQILSQLGISNASLITITPTGQVGWVPFSQWVSVPSQPISYCRLLSVYGLNTISENTTAVTYQVVVGTNTPMNNFPLNYPLLLRYTYFVSGVTGTELVPVFVHAFGYGEVYKALITVKREPFGSAFISFPMCNLPPGSVSISQSLVTTNVSSLIRLYVTFTVSNPPSIAMAFPGVVYLNNTLFYTFSVTVPPGAYGATTTIEFKAPNDPGTYIGNVTVFGLSTPIELVVEGPPSVNTTNSTSPPSPGTNSTSNTPPPPPPNTGSSSSSSSSSSSTSSSSASSSTTTASTILTKLLASLADALTTVRTYLANPIVMALLVLAIVAIAYIIYKRLTEVVIKL